MAPLLGLPAVPCNQAKPAGGRRQTRNAGLPDAGPAHTAAAPFRFDLSRPPLYRPGEPKPDAIVERCMPEILALAIIAAVLLLGALIGLAGSRPLLAWYLREVRGLTLAPAPGEAIVTYPMA
jgi:hypothetical protein